MKTTDVVVEDLAKVINILLGKDTPCAKCGVKLKARKSTLFVSGVGVLHDSCYKELVREVAALARA